MAKRIYFQSIIKRLRILGIVAGTLIGSLFFYLVSIDAIEVTGHSGDSVCAGSIEDPCYAYINFTVKNTTVGRDDIFIYRTDYDPWGRNTSFDFDPNVKSWLLQRSWGKGWRNIPLDKGCTGTWCGAPDSKGEPTYSVVFREGRDYQIRIVVYKNDPTEDIKWSALDGRVDPIFFGIGKGVSESAQVTFTSSTKTSCVITPFIIEHNQTFCSSFKNVGTKTVLNNTVVSGPVRNITVNVTECTGNSTRFWNQTFDRKTCTVKIWNTPQFTPEDGIWKNKSDARSLKDDPKYWLEIISDGRTNLTMDSIFDFNDSSITFDDTRINYSDTSIEIRTVDKFSGLDIRKHTLNTRDVGTLVNRTTLEFGRGKEVHFGQNSTTVTLQSENLDDTYIQEDDASDAKGDDGDLELENSTGAFSSQKISFVKFDLTSIPPNITVLEAILRLELDNNGMDAGEALRIHAHHVYPHNAFNVSGSPWTEGASGACSGADLCWDTRPTTVSEMNMTADSSIVIDENEVTTTEHNWSVNQTVQSALNLGGKNVTIALLPTIESGSPGSVDFVFFDSKENLGGADPILEVTYQNVSILFVTPTDANATTFNGQNTTYINASVTVSGSPIYNFEIQWNETNVTVWSPNRILGNWRMDANANDSSGNFIDGTLQNQVNCNAANDHQFVGSCEFDGTTDFILLSNEVLFDLDTADPWTISAWVHPRASAFKSIFVKQISDTGYYVYHIGSAGGVNFGISFEASGAGANGTRTVIDYALDTWYHLTWVYSGTGTSGMLIYVNGEVVATDTDTATLTASVLNDYIPTIGSHNAGANSFDGFIDEMRFANYTLTSDEIEIGWRSSYGKYFANITQIKNDTYEYYAWVNTTNDEFASTETRVLCVGADQESNCVADAPAVDNNGTLLITLNNPTSFSVSQNDTLNLNFSWISEGGDYQNQSPNLFLNVSGSGVIGTFVNLTEFGQPFYLLTGSLLNTTFLPLADGDGNSVNFTLNLTAIGLNLGNYTLTLNISSNDTFSLPNGTVPFSINISVQTDAGDDCTCPDGSAWIVKDGSSCTLTDECLATTVECYADSKIEILTGGSLPVATQCSFQDGCLNIQDGAGPVCGI